MLFARDANVSVTGDAFRVMAEAINLVDATASKIRETVKDEDQCNSMLKVFGIMLKNAAVYGLEREVEHDPDEDPDQP